MRHVEHIKTSRGVDLLTTCGMTHYVNDTTKVYITTFINEILKKGNYTFIDLFAVATQDFVKFSQQCVAAIKKNNLQIENIVLFSPFESYSYRYYNFMFTIFALSGTKNILLLDAGIGRNDKFIEHCFENLSVTQQYFGYFTQYYTDNVGHLPNTPLADIQKKQHFCSLGRWPRYERIKFTNLLLKNNSIVNKGLISCAWAPYNKEMQKWEMPAHDLILSIIPKDLQPKYPLIWSCNFDANQYDIEKEIAECAINVLLEGDVGYSTNTYAFRHSLPLSILNEMSDRATINEKTVKMFLSYQLPLFLAMPGYVEDLRKLGFDVFDDFINHDYDNVDDLETRIQMVYRELVRLCDLELLDIENFIDTNKPRISSNVEKLKEFSDNCILNIQKLIDQF